MTGLKRWLALLLVAALAFGMVGMVGCTDDDNGEDDTDTTDTTDDTMDDDDVPSFETITDGIIVAGSDTAYPPFEAINADGDVEGFDVDLLAAVADELGVDYEFLTYNFDALIMGVQTGTEFDIIVSAMTITDERDEEIDFTDPYFLAGQSLAVRDDATYESLEDLAGQKIGVQSGTTGEAYTTDNLPEGATVVPFENILQAFQALQNGDVEGVVNDKPISESIVADEARELMVVGETMSEEQYGFGVSEDNPDLTEALNWALAKVKDSGEYDDIMEKWFSAE
jgi:polar amino acid transport system substrate-binding protein